VTKRPLELADPVRNEDDLIPFEFTRAGHVRSVHLPRWVAVRIVEMDERKWSAVRDADREYRSRNRYWGAGAFYGCGFALLIGMRYVPAGLLFWASGMLLTWPALRDRWTRWRGR